MIAQSQAKVDICSKQSFKNFVGKDVILSTILGMVTSYPSSDMIMPSMMCTLQHQFRSLTIIDYIKFTNYIPIFAKARARTKMKDGQFLPLNICLI